MTKLSAYLDSNNIRQEAFATRAGTTQATISKLASGAQLPSLDLAIRIERLTAGAVPASSWISAPNQEDAA